MPEKNTPVERAEPKRWLTKQDALRRLIHTSTRMTVAGQDPFAINLLINSADKLAIDLLKREGIADPFPIESVLPPQARRKFFEIYRETSNFFKHADKDHDGQLPVYEIVFMNDVILLSCMVRYLHLFSGLTRHMMHFTTFLMVSYPHLLDWDHLPVAAPLKPHISELRESTRGALLETLAMAFVLDPETLKELEQDLVDVREANAGPALARRSTETEPV